MALLFLHYCLMLACLLASLPLGSGAGSRTLCHIDTVNSDSLGAWLWEHAKSKQLSIALTFCEQRTDQGKMLSISVYFHKKLKPEEGSNRLFWEFMKRDFCEMDIIFHKTEDWSSWSYILEFVLKLLILGNIMKLLSSIRELSRFFFWKMVTKTLCLFFYIRRYAREINCITSIFVYSSASGCML